MRLVLLNMFKPSSIFADRSFQGGTSFVDPVFDLCFMFDFVMLSCLFLAALWSPDLLDLLCVVLFVFSSLPIWCLGSGVILDCLDS